MERSDDSNSSNKLKEEDLGYTLDKALVSIRGHNGFFFIILSVFVSFAFPEAILFNLPFLQLIPPMECFNGTGWSPCLPETACTDGSIMRPVQ